MSIGQLKRRAEALRRKLDTPDKRGYSLEELHRALWVQDRASYQALVDEGICSARFFQEAFEREDAGRMAIE